MIKAILFNTEMVRAILEGRKTVTRRVVKPQFPVYRSGEEDSFAEIEPWGTHSFLGGHKNHPSAGTVLNPPYEAGDILYVREAFAKIENEIVGQFDMGCLDIWYVKKDCEPHRRSGSGRGGRGAGSEERRCQHDRVDGGRPATSESAPGDSRQPEGTGGDAACVTDGDH